MIDRDPKPGRLLLAVTVATLTIFGGLILGFTLNLRSELREQVLRREAEAIYAVALLQLGPADNQLAEFGEEFVIDDLFAAVLESSRLKGVLGVQLFDADGALRKANPIAPDDAESSRWWDNGLAWPQARFIRNGTLGRVSPRLALETRTTAAVPLMDIAVPLRAEASVSPNLAVARYWVNGAPVAAEFVRMDRGLAMQAGVAFAGGAVLIALVLAWAFSRLAEANRRLVEQSADLARANEELDFAAKTGALGAISAHLIHGLNNPLAGIEGFVADAATGANDDLRGDACRTAVETTRRLRALVNEVATVLRDESAGESDHHVPVAEVVEAARIRAAPAAGQAEVLLEAAADPDARVVGRTASLAGLVLANLIANAIEASPRGARIALEARAENGRVEFIVRDTGPGLPATVQGALFRPVRSTKRGGGGVGLAISHRLAKHAGGELELVRSDGSGTVFRLRVPAAAQP